MICVNTKISIGHKSIAELLPTINSKLRDLRQSLIGPLRVTAEVLTKEPKGFVCLSVCKREILANLAARVLEPFKKGESIRRARRTIWRGKWRKLAWSDEDARANVTSKFVG